MEAWTVGRANILTHPIDIPERPVKTASDLTPVPMDRVTDAALLLGFLSGRATAEYPPPYGAAGPSAMGTYLNFFMGPGSDHFLWKDGAGTIVAYARVCPPDESRPKWAAAPNSWSLLVHPRDWGVDLVSAVAAHAETALGGSAEAPIVTEAYEGDEAMTALLERRGYRRDAYLAPYMTRALDDRIPEVEVPDGYQLRSFLPDSELIERAGAAHDAFGGTPEPPPWLVDSVERMVEYRTTRALGEDDLVAVTETGEIASHACVLLDPVTSHGELEGVGTRPAHVRRGLARAISLSGLRCMRASGMRHAVVRTGVDNEAAIRLYESVGFRVTDKLYRYVKSG